MTALKTVDENGNYLNDIEIVDSSPRCSSLYEHYRQLTIQEHPGASHAWVCMLARKRAICEVMHEERVPGGSDAR